MPYHHLRLIFGLLLTGALFSPLLSQPVCDSEEPFLLPPTSTFCADSLGMVTIDFKIYNNGSPGSYRVRFPDGSDTLYTNVVNTVTVIKKFKFLCDAPPGKPIPPKPGALFYEYQGALTVTREDCVDERGDNQRGTYDFRVVPNPINNIKTSDLTCIEEPYEIEFEGVMCSEKLVESYQWYMDGELIPDATTPFLTYTFDGPGSHIARLEVTAFKGCDKYVFNKPFTIRPSPKIDLQYTLDSTQLCDPQIMIITESTYEHATNFSWTSDSPDVSFDDPTSPNPVITIQNDSAGIRTIVVSVGNEFCAGVSDSFRITTQRGQTIQVLEDILTCTDYELDLCANLRYLPTPENIFWTADKPGVNFDDRRATCPRITFDNTGNYLLYANGSDVCGESFNIPIKVRVRDGRRLNIDISAVDTLCTIDSTITLMNYIDRPENVALITGDGVADNIFDPSVVEGDVRVTVRDSCGAVYPMNFHVVPQEYYTGIDPTLCMGDSVNLFAIQPGDYMGTGVTNNVFRTDGLSTGTYKIAFNSTTYCGGQDTLTIRVQEYPEASFAIVTDSCVGDNSTGVGPVFAGLEPIFIENTSTARVVCYEVLETGREVCGRNNARFAFREPGVYTIQQVVSFPDGVCSDTVEQVIEVQFPPELDYSYSIDSTGCDSLKFDFAIGRQDTFVTYQWNFSTTDISEEAEPRLELLRPLIPSTLGINAAVANACYTSADTFAVVLPQRFQVGYDILNDNNTVCSDDTIKLANTSVNAQSYRVTFPDGRVADELPRTLVIRNTSERVMKYPILFEGYNDACPDEAMSDTVFVLPIKTEAAFGLDYEDVCSATEVTLTNASTPGSLAFVDWGDGSSPQLIDDLASVPHTYDVQRDTTYTINMSAQLCGLDSFAHTLTVRMSPDASFEAVALEANCIDKDIEFRSLATAAPYGVDWDFGDGSPRNQLRRPRHRFAESGNYRVFCDVVSENGCFSRDSLDIEIGEYDGPPMAFTMPETVCTDGDFAIDITSPSSGWTIDYGNGMISKAPMQRPYFSKGDFTVRLTNTSANGCSIDSLRRVRVFSGFDVNITTATGDTTVEFGDYLDLAAVISPPRNVTDVLWTGDSITNPFSPVTNALPLNDGFYSLSLRDEHGCQAADSMLVRVIKRYDGRVFAPNAFSPNGDGVNENFSIEVKPNVVRRVRNFRVYSRFGGVVYECNGCAPGTVDNGWDGTVNGQPAQTGVFVWTAEVEFLDGTRKEFSGDVALVR